MVFVYNLFNLVFELIVCHTAAEHTCRNPVEHIHAIAHLGMQSLWMMGQKISADVEKPKKFNSNKELYKATKCHDSLEEALDESHSVPINLLKSSFSQLSLKDEKLKIFEPT